MLIRCWGSRGSIPVSGQEYLKYGGDTTCLELRTKNDTIIIIDAGSGIRRLGNQLLKEERLDYKMIFTHAHWDHLLGFPFFKPLYTSQAKLVMYGCPFVQTSVREMISRVMTSPNFPVNYDDLKADIQYQSDCEDAFTIDTVTVNPISLSHPNGGNGYRFTEDGKSLVFLTDNELTFRHPGGLDYCDYLEFSKGADLFIHDAEFTDEDYEQTETWGHSRYRDALRLAMEAGVKQFGLFHHNQDRNDESLDGIVSDCRRIIAKSEAKLDCFAVSQYFSIKL
ncbi:MAG: MBL fold metallo-hydrolase [Deltaproteobacteria bacterium]|nr:MBL fold metallo-hydrolase [Deltaproteobacteria bacterium]